MKRFDLLIISVFVFLLSSFCATTASAQTVEVPEGYELVDTVVYRHVSRVDSLLSGKDIFHIMPLKANGGKADVEIYQPQEVAAALRKQVENNSKRTISGYRVRIFFDNKQTARVESEGGICFWKPRQVISCGFAIPAQTPGASHVRLEPGQ